MKFRKNRPKPKLGDERFRARFLLFPKTMYHSGTNDTETRWLERAIWVQIYKLEYMGNASWVDDRWLNDNGK